MAKGESDCMRVFFFKTLFIRTSAAIAARATTAVGDAAV